jgi:Rhs element Vgr protein
MTEADKEGYESYKITIGSKSFEPTSAERISSINVVYRANKVPYAIIYFIDGDAAKETFSLSSTADIEPGSVVTIEMGYKGVNVKVFKGVIVKHSMKLVAMKTYTYIECKDPVFKMTVAKKNRVFGDGSSAIADDANFTTIFTDYSLNSRLEMKGTPYIAQNSITQFYCSDWDFVLSRAELNGKMILIKKPGSDYGKISIDNPLSTETAVSTYTFGKNLLDFDFESNATTQIKEAEVSTWKEDTQEVLKSAKATSSTFKQLEKKGIKFDDLKTITSPSTLELFHGGSLVKAEIDGWSKAIIEKSAHSKVKGTFKVKGDNSINLGDVVELKGLGTKFSGNVVATGVRQQFTAGGWFTIVSFGIDAGWHYENFSISAPPAAGLLPGVSGLQIGKVLAYADDPAGQHRVKIKLPMFKSTEVFWARMLFEYAGTGRGNFFWPEVDDEVLVGFLNDDPRNPVILGSMCSKAQVPVIARPTSDKDIKAIITKKDLRIEFDDLKKIITIKTPGANSITIDDENKNMILKDQHGNVISMEKDAIKIDSVGELKLSAAKKITISSSGGDIALEGTNIKSTAKAKFEVSGNAGLDLKTSAIAEIKGTLVKIN